jgi:uncharacterized protein (DUF1499 family)
MKGRATLKICPRNGLPLFLLVTTAIQQIILGSVAWGESLLQNCPDTPNCISSLAQDDHHIEPITVRGDARSAVNRLRELLAGRNDSHLIKSTESSIVVEFHTMLGFVDDAVFILDPLQKVIHVRSASRIGYWDLGKNRRRMEEIRREFQTEDVCLSKSIYM